MKRWIEFPLEDGTTILMELDEPDQGIGQGILHGQLGVQVQSH
jgi:hypothetical protein